MAADSAEKEEHDNESLNGIGKPRVVGDALLSEKERVTWQTHQLAKATDNTIPSGIDGMVRILISIPRNSLP